MSSDAPPDAPTVPPRPRGPPISLEAQESVTPSEDWGSEDEAGDYLHYYGEEDVDANLIASGASLLGGAWVEGIASCVAL